MKSLSRLLIVVCGAWVVAGCATTAQQPKPLVQTAAPKQEIICDFSRKGIDYEGTCAVSCSANALAINFDGVDAKRSCDGAPRVVNATLSAPIANRWLGKMQGVQPEDPTRLEIVPNKQGGGSVARTPYGWFAVSSMDAGRERLNVVIDASRQVRPTADDLAIIDRAIALIPDASVWNKNDNRECPPGQTRLSMFCALMQATTEISGGIHYRQPAMQAVREMLNTVDKSRIKTHRIMDYNNHPDTTLAEIHGLLKSARDAVARDVR